MMISVQINYFGAFRQFGDGQTIDLPAGSTINDLKSIFADKLGKLHATLVQESVFANESEILIGDFVLENSTILSVLPPVCGG